ncbi:uncharacterized protein VDAG_07950 [Verticillium dahliae VdLs.17]|uniref:Uncharacterized protein n=1 Tax=Verticillium dahliae (strain VdLs.17 / ATCC MYA-4575 / FGSC 10137) TaxID=498257 RepID=G2XCR8_VERDV|nr:uncharacterized protein VDAG_07950 [Verticillium dahliae VdLs.17]EGY16786.1 hypothetical protein VDAG_07950 [Verticillium dahliae VdLs.17]KAH6706844.1 hypothetical protein EV126DRAFT_332727 [Verticillium dahliae]
MIVSRRKDPPALLSTKASRVQANRTKRKLQSGLFLFGQFLSVCAAQRFPTLTASRNSRARICEFTFLRAPTSLLVSSEFVLLAARLRDERLFHMVFERLDHPSKGFVMEHVTDNFLFAFENLQALEVVRFKFRRVLKLERKEVEANEVTLTSHVVAGVPVPVAWFQPKEPGQWTVGPRGEAGMEERR